MYTHPTPNPWTKEEKLLYSCLSTKLSKQLKQTDKALSIKRSAKYCFVFKSSFSLLLIAQLRAVEAMKLNRVILLIFLFYSPEIFGRRIREFSEYDDVSNENDYNVDYEDDPEGGQGQSSTYDDMTCSTTSFSDKLSDLYDLDGKILVITKLDLVADANEIKK